MGILSLCMIKVTFEVSSNVEYHAELDEPPSESWPEMTSTSYRIEIRTDEEIAEGSYESEHSHSFSEKCGPFQRYHSHLI